MTVRFTAFSGLMGNAKVRQRSKAFHRREVRRSGFSTRACALPAIASSTPFTAGIVCKGLKFDMHFDHCHANHRPSMIVRTASSICVVRCCRTYGARRCNGWLRAHKA